MQRLCCQVHLIFLHFAWSTPRSCRKDWLPIRSPVIFDAHVKILHIRESRFQSKAGSCATWCAQTLPWDASSSIRTLSTPIASGFLTGERSLPLPALLFHAIPFLEAKVQHNELLFPLPPFLTVELIVFPRVPVEWNTERQPASHRNQKPLHYHGTTQVFLITIVHPVTSLSRDWDYNRCKQQTISFWMAFLALIQLNFDNCSQNREKSVKNYNVWIWETESRWKQ